MRKSKEQVSYGHTKIKIAHTKMIVALKDTETLGPGIVDSFSYGISPKGSLSLSHKSKQNEP